MHQKENRLDGRGRRSYRICRENMQCGAVLFDSGAACVNFDVRQRRKIFMKKVARMRYPHIVFAHQCGGLKNFWNKKQIFYMSQSISNQITKHFPFFWSLLYRDRLKGLYEVAIIFLLILLNCSAWPCLGPA